MKGGLIKKLIGSSGKIATIWNLCPIPDLYSGKGKNLLFGVCPKLWSVGFLDLDEVLDSDFYISFWVISSNICEFVNPK